ncbi:hypothetical protein Naga_100308g6 [Nannochloropsis gaditana]|uniref:Uncharacterized protein n=1 Tax=Nannochloropsis gaditana TaxID=72520 RepID=W7TPD4_9STRA|nr:hypothetical protein Naga_100308g6 [Nannochloropsis gaditana]
MPAVLFNALAMGALRGFLDTTTPLLVITAAFILDYACPAEWLSWLLPSTARTTSALLNFGVTTVLADYAATLMYAWKFFTLYPARRRATNLSEFLVWWQRAWRQERKMRARQKKQRRVIELAEDDNGASLVHPPAWPFSKDFPPPQSLPPTLWKIVSQGWSVLTRSVLYQILLLSASSLGPSLLPSAQVGRRLLQYGSAGGFFFGIIYLLGGASAHSWSVFKLDTAAALKLRPILWIVSLLVPVTAIVQVGGGILQGAQDFDYQARLMGLCVLLSGSLLHLTTHGRDATAFVGSGAGQLFSVWMALLVFQSLRALGFAYRFWIDATCPLSAASNDGSGGRAQWPLNSWLHTFWQAFRNKDGIINRAALQLPSSVNYISRAAVGNSTNLLPVLYNLIIIFGEQSLCRVVCTRQNPGMFQITSSHFIILSLGRISQTGKGGFSMQYSFDMTQCF